MEPVATHAYPGIEVLPQEYDQFGNSLQHSSLPVSGDKEVHTPNTPTANDRHRRRILGLTVPVFWALLIIFVLVLAGALGGGIGGGLAAQKHSAGGSAATPTATTTLQAGEQPTGTDTDKILLPLMQPDTEPKDGGCPGINGKNFTSTFMLRGQTMNQTFEQRCDTNYADGDKNRELRDLLSFFTRSFDECMNTCAQYNQQLQKQREAASLNRGTGGEGYCNVATIAKLPGGRCYLKSKGRYDLENTIEPGEQVTAAVLVGGVDQPTT